MKFTFELEGEMVEAELPEDLHYHPDHCWARVENGKVRVGFDDFGQVTAGQILFIRLKPVGREVKQNETFGSLETGKWVGPLRSPVSGTIVETNPEIKANPSIVNEDPYGKGWLILVDPSNLEEELKNLITGEAIKEWIEREIRERLKKQ
ncbi:MAG: glycine cleavage system protein H [Candidatus Freyarchaeota archaeon]|nr:glycine cleavage system protein H [Candidatus Freyrarchaeum guaymaensis]